MNFTDKIALITGASSGIGEGVTKSLLKQGCRVIGLGLEPEHQLKHELYQYYKADVRDPEEIKDVMDMIQKQVDQLDILVNSAGICGFTETLENTSLSRFKDIFDTDVFGVYNVVKQSVDLLKKSPSANIVTISSTLGIKHTPGSIAYGPAKAAINKLTKNLAVEYGGQIRVNAVAPSLIKTLMTENTNDLKYSARQEIVNTYPMKRAGEIEEVVHAVLFLASEQSSFITGEILLVSGGGH